MTERTKRGYARLLRDLEKLDSQERFKEMMERGYGAVKDLDSLIDRVNKLAQQGSFTKEGKPKDHRHP
ncbi:MAG: hypothetical protein O7F12_15640 [Nitrospirae bacterium]|nr:hypothetical protein [Nitrospirota bacterium]